MLEAHDPIKFICEGQDKKACSKSFHCTLVNDLIPWSVQKGVIIEISHFSH